MVKHCLSYRRLPGEGAVIPFTNLHKVGGRERKSVCVRVPFPSGSSQALAEDFVFDVRVGKLDEGLMHNICDKPTKISKCSLLGEMTESKNKHH